MIFIMLELLIIALVLLTPLIIMIAVAGFSFGSVLWHIGLRHFVSFLIRSGCWVPILFFSITPQHARSFYYHWKYFWKTNIPWWWLPAAILSIILFIYMFYRAILHLKRNVEAFLIDNQLEREKMTFRLVVNKPLKKPFVKEIIIPESIRHDFEKVQAYLGVKIKQIIGGDYISSPIELERQYLNAIETRDAFLCYHIDCLSIEQVNQFTSVIVGRCINDLFDHMSHSFSIHIADRIHKNRDNHEFHMELLN